MATYRQWLNDQLAGRTIYTRNVLNVQKCHFGALDEGPGIRHALFLQGCPNFCPGCRNIQAKEIRLRSLLTPQRISNDICRVGFAKLATLSYAQDIGFSKILYLNAVRHILWDILNTNEYIARSQQNDLSEYVQLIQFYFDKLSQITRGHDPMHSPDDWLTMPITGVTISGGEPLLQPVQVKNLIESIRSKRPDWNICLYSGMYTWDQLLNDNFLRSLVEMTDMVKLGKFKWMEENVAHFYYGSSNQMILDTQKSLRNGQPYPIHYSDEIESALMVTNWHREHDYIPVVRTYILDILRMLSIESKSIDVCEDFELFFGRIDENITEKIFTFHPRETYGPVFHNIFHNDNLLHISHIEFGPLSTTEKLCCQIYLQGSQQPPSVDSDPAACDFAYGKGLDVDVLLQKILAYPEWVFYTERMPDDGQYLRMNLALQKRLLEVQGAYFMLHSPYGDMSIKEYREIIRRYQKQIQFFFGLTGSGQCIPCRTLFFRMGDPLLQADPLAALCQKAQNAGFEIWIEIPHPLDGMRETLSSLHFMRYVDFVVCGDQYAHDFPCILPFQSSIAQRMYDAQTLQPWSPRYKWSEQVIAYVNTFQEPAAIAGYTLSPSLVSYFRDVSPKIMPVEDFEHQAGALEIDWSSWMK